MFIFSSSLPLRPIYIEIFSTSIPTKHATRSPERVLFLGRTVGSFKLGEQVEKVDYKKVDVFTFDLIESCQIVHNHLSMNLYWFEKKF